MGSAMVTYRAGGEVDALCNRCKLVLAHTILAVAANRIARVRCNTCRGEHAFRGQAPAAASKRTLKAETKAEKTVISFQQRIAERDPDRAKAYRPSESFQVEDLISHPTFGLGIVSAVRPGKMEVAFKSSEKTLVQGRTSPSSS